MTSTRTSLPMASSQRPRAAGFVTWPCTHGTISGAATRISAPRTNCSLTARRRAVRPATKPSPATVSSAGAAALRRAVASACSSLTSCARALVLQRLDQLVQRRNTAGFVDRLDQRGRPVWRLGPARQRLQLQPARPPRRLRTGCLETAYRPHTGGRDYTIIASEASCIAPTSRARGTATGAPTGAPRRMTSAQQDAEQQHRRQRRGPARSTSSSGWVWCTG